MCSFFFPPLSFEVNVLHGENIWYKTRFPFNLSKEVYVKRRIFNKKFEIHYDLNLLCGTPIVYDLPES